MDGLLSLLLFGAFAFWMMRYGCGSHVGHGGHLARDASADPTDANHQGIRDFVDPVCRMQVAQGEGYLKHYHGMAYHFCSRSCLDKFEADPDLYLGKDAPPPDPAHHGGL